MKCQAKLKLLEAGIMDAVQTIDDMNIVTKGDEDAESEDGEPGETIEAFAARLEIFVRLTLSRASGSKRDSYKDSLVYQARRDVIMDFLKTAITKKCNSPSCGA